MNVNNHGYVIFPHRTNVVSKNAIHTWVHWHALPVLSLTYTPEGTYLLSGGHESVLAKWSHESYGDHSQREYLPRLGAPVSHIALSADNSVYVTTHMDNCESFGMKMRIFAIKLTDSPIAILMNSHIVFWLLIILSWGILLLHP